MFGYNCLVYRWNVVVLDIKGEGALVTWIFKYSGMTVSEVVTFL